MQTDGFLQASLHTTWLPPTEAFAGSDLEIFQVTIYIMHLADAFIQSDLQYIAFF